MVIELFKDKKGYTIRKGILRNGYYVDNLTEKELINLAKRIFKGFKIKTYEDFVTEVEEDKKKFLGGFAYKK